MSHKQIELECSLMVCLNKERDEKIAMSMPDFEKGGYISSERHKEVF